MVLLISVLQTRGFSGVEQNEFSGDYKPAQGRLMPVPGKMYGAYAPRQKLYHKTPASMRNSCAFARFAALPSKN
jgi:hypothetical protein